MIVVPVYRITDNILNFDSIIASDLSGKYVTAGGTVYNDTLIFSDGSLTAINGGTLPYLTLEHLGSVLGVNEPEI